MTPADPRWLRWQLTRRGGLLWHETCATCQNWEPCADEPGWGACLEVMAPHDQTQAEQACSCYHERIAPCELPSS